MRTISRLILSVFALCLLWGWGAEAQQPTTQSSRTFIYIVRHAEATEGTVDESLTEAGKARAKVFEATVHDVRFTDVFSTHTTRARQIVEPVAVDHGLVVKQVPQPGSILDGKVVTNTDPSQIAITPLVNALKQLPAGRSALVGVNAANAYAIMNGLGVPVAPAGGRCDPRSACVPCLTNSCFPVGEFDHYWILIIEANRPPQLISLRYGDVALSPTK